MNFAFRRLRERVRSSFRQITRIMAALFLLSAASGFAVDKKTRRSVSGLACHAGGDNTRMCMVAFDEGDKAGLATLGDHGYTIDPHGHGQYAYHTDLVHYFPGRRESGTGDVKPSAEEIELNRHWFEIEMESMARILCTESRAWA